MKKFFFLALAITTFSTAFVSCKDEKDQPVVANEDYSKYEYSQLAPAQQKEKLSADAKTFLEKMEGLSTTKGADLLESFNNRCDISTPDLEKKPVDGSIIAINEFHGKFTWTESTQTWKKEVQTGKLTFIFPSTPAGKTNDATIDITGVASDANEEGYQLPKELLAKLFAGATQVGTISVKATEIVSEKAPKTAEVIYSMDAYTLVVNANKGTTNTSTFELKKGGEVLLKGSGDFVADLDEAIADDKLNPGKANVVIDITPNLSIAGYIEFGKKQEAENKLIYPDHPKYPYTLEAYNKYNGEKKTYSEKKAEAFNNNSDLYLVSRSDKKKIAAVKQMSKLDYEYSWTSNGVTFTDEDYIEVNALKFGDGTTVEAEVYFDEGFDTVINKWEEITAKFK